MPGNMQVRQAPTVSSKADFYLSAVRVLNVVRYTWLMQLQILANDFPDKGTEHYNFDDGIVTVLQYK